jgi:hypothetical protein
MLPDGHPPEHFTQVKGRSILSRAPVSAQRKFPIAFEGGASGMANRLLLSAILLALLIISPGHAMAAADFSAAQLAGVNRITAQDLKAKIDGGENVVILDARSGGEYEGSKIKIPGSIRMPLFDVETRYKELPTDREIVTYCT